MPEAREGSANGGHAAAHVGASGLDFFRLDGRTAIITGGAGVLGGAMARGLVAAGASVGIADREQAGAEATAAELVAMGGDALALPVDVTDETSVEGMVRHAMGRWGHLDILINAAGIGSLGPAVAYDQRRFEEVLGVNLTGMFLCCREAGEIMLEAGRGCIVNIASIAGLVGISGRVAYLASKGGVVQLTHALAIEWALSGIRVNAIAPGVIETDKIAARAAEDPEFYADSRAKHPIGRFGQPEEIVGPAIFLCSDAASFMTGHILAVDGGYVAQ